MHFFYHASQRWHKLSCALMIAAFIANLPLAIAQQDIPKKGNKLVGRAVLPAATFAPGPTSGTRLGNSPINGQTVPFINKQPVQGFSAVLDNKDGTFMVMSDNGFGSIENSADYHLRVYTIKPRFEKKNSGKGDVVVKNYIELHDPEKHIPFAITNHFTKDRILTGADFDIESMQRTEDGTLWFGDEFGPFLIHTDGDGKVLEAPIALPDFDNPGKEIRALQNPYNEEISAIRIMNAVKTHAAKNGNMKTPVFSPWYVMIDDANPDTFSPDRKNPPAGLAAASSDIFNVASIKNAGYPVVAWTVNDKPSMESLLKLGVNGIISDRPDLLRQVVEAYDGNSDGKPDFLDADGLIDISLFDAQGHRGSRSLRPENTLPSMEAALDNLMTTLELDCGITKDNQPVLDHDPYIEAEKARRADGQPYIEEVLIKNHTLAEIQSTFIADKLLEGRPDQTNDKALSPVAVAFATANNLADPYIMPSLGQVFDFVKYYATYYKSGAGSNHTDATKRWKNAERVRFNIETKINPRTDTDDKGKVFAERTVDAETFAKSVADIIVTNKLEDRADIQSFGFATLLEVQEKYPAIRTVYLFGDFPKVGDQGDGTNLQDQEGKNSPWLGGLYWPYRSTALSNPFRARTSGGFEGMAYSIWDNKLFPLLEQPLINGESKTLLIHEFDLAAKKYTGIRHKYILEPNAGAIGDFVMFRPERGLVIERDGSQGDLKGFKAIYEIEFKEAEKPVGKRLAVDLLNIKDPSGISQPGLDGDVGIGEKFAFPFTTIEDVVVFSEKKIGVLNDNNYPFSIGRHVGQKLPDDNEFIIIKLDKALGKDEIKGRAGFTLVNADTDTDMQLLKDKDVLTIPQLPTSNLNIRAEFPGEDVKSVIFDFNNQKNYRIENRAPYSLGGDTEGNYNAIQLPAGRHTLVATPYSSPNGKGVAGIPLKISFTVELGSVVSFTLIDADTDKEIGPLQNGDKLDLTTLPTRNLSIRANTDSKFIESVVFGLNEQSVLITENTEPFTIAGSTNGDINSFTPLVGTYTLTATPYAEDDGNGVAGKLLSLAFEVVETKTEAATASSRQISLFPNPITDIVQIQLNQYPDEHLHISLLDSYGKEIYENNKRVLGVKDVIELNVGNLNLRKGIYFIHISSPSSSLVFRLYKE